ncbi:TonB-dependent receptor [Malikia sp.]|uniref:TonB-dependent receptor n=1 Tax=Malikia sp. TaxID=2070706 RepID=UPI002605E097|nr:TonB-dependent receptor [Malikia sp.]MDD2728213.1 TonB-dependent receptor [Malikia sp.]
MKHASLSPAALRPSRSSLALAAVLPLVGLQLAHAQSGPTKLAAVIVSAEREPTLPQAAAEYQAEQLMSRRAATSDTASLLQDIPGVSLYGAGGASSLPSIHGLADDRLRIKVDGMDLVASCPNHMNPPLSYLDPTQVGKVEVHAGIAPVSSGGDSIGGTIIVETQAPEFAVPGQGLLTQGEVGTFYRSNGDAHGANLSATLASDSLSLSYSAATAQAGNYQAGNYQAGGDFKTSTATGRAGHALPLDEVGSTAYETRNQTLGLAFKEGRHLIEAKLGVQDVPYQLYPNQRMDMLGNQQQRISLRYQGDHDWGRLEARAYHETVDHFMDFGADKRFYYGDASWMDPVKGAIGKSTLDGTYCPSPLTPGCAHGMPMYTQSKTDGLSIKADIALGGKDLLRVGAELQQYRLDDWWAASGVNMAPGVFLNIHDGERDRKALFVEWEARLNPQWTTLAGLRHERVITDAGNVHGYADTNGMAPMFNYQQRDSKAFNALDRKRSDDNLDLTLLARHQIDASRDLEFGFARKTRSPNLYERYTWSTWAMAAVMNNFVGDGNGYWGNPDLKAEKANTLSATYDWHAANREWGFKATPFYTQVQDYIDAIDVDPKASYDTGFKGLQYANQSARLYGIDLSGHMPLAQTGYGRWGLKGLLNYTHGENRDSGDALYNVMPLNARLTLTHQQGGWDNALELLLVQGKHNTSDVRNEISTKGYGLVNLRVSHGWKQVRLDFGIENLFDKAYALPLGGAYFGQGKTMSTSQMTKGVNWGTAVPGVGRTLYTGVNIRF